VHQHAAAAVVLIHLLRIPAAVAVIPPRQDLEEAVAVPHPEEAVEVVAAEEMAVEGAGNFINKKYSLQ
jgi:hypothetical protein